MGIRRGSSLLSDLFYFEKKEAGSADGGGRQV